MSGNVLEFNEMDHCDCCARPLSRDSKTVVICRFPEGTSDTLCRKCFFETTASAIAWCTFEGNLGPESTESRLRRARDLARARIAANTLAGLVFDD
jgi:hypothetical protein